MQSVTLITVGKLSDKNCNEIANDFVKRLGAFCKISLVEIAQTKMNEKNISKATIDKTLQKEAQFILNAVPKNSIIVALCIEGKQLKSEEFSNYIQECAKSGNSNITFIIGSSHGLANEIKQIANLKMSMSKMTFPHKLAKVMLLEQIYRAYSIQAKTKYHK